MGRKKKSTITQKYKRQVIIKEKRDVGQENLGNNVEEREKTGNQKRKREKLREKYGYRIQGRKPKGLQHATYTPMGPEDVRCRVRIMTLDVGSFSCHKEVIECFLNDHRIHIATIAESNITKSKLDTVEVKGYARSNRCCRKDEPIKGG